LIRKVYSFGFKNYYLSSIIVIFLGIPLFIIFDSLQLRILWVISIMVAVFTIIYRFFKRDVLVIDKNLLIVYFPLRFKKEINILNYSDFMIRGKFLFKRIVAYDIYEKKEKALIYNNYDCSLKEINDAIIAHVDYLGL